MSSSCFVVSKIESPDSWWRYSQSKQNNETETRHPVCVCGVCVRVCVLCVVCGMRVCGMRVCVHAPWDNTH